MKCHFATYPLAATIPAYNDTTGLFAFGFTASTVVLNFRSGGAPVFFSFDGTQDHGVLYDALGYMKAIELNLRTNRIWVRGGDATTVLDIWATPKQD